MIAIIYIILREKSIAIFFPEWNESANQTFEVKISV